LEQGRRARQRVVLVHKHAIHVGQPALDFAAIAHGDMVPGADFQLVASATLEGLRG